MKNLLILIAALFATYIADAQALVQTMRDEVNLRSAPSTTAPVVKKSIKGQIFQIQGSQQGWHRVMPVTGGDIVWISQSVVSKAPDYVGYTPAYPLVSLELDLANGYSRRKGFKGGEVVETWKFGPGEDGYFESEKASRQVVAQFEERTVYNTGRMISTEKLYKGTCAPADILLNQISNDGGETWEPLTPMISIYPSITEDTPSGIYVNGTFFEDNDNADF